MKLDLKTLKISTLENEVLNESMKVEFKSLVKRPRKIIGESHCRNNCFENCLKGWQALNLLLEIF